jgi:large subunit ribosomal protein L24
MNRFVKGDTVVVTAGNHKGRKGKVKRIVGERVIVEGVNMVKRHRKQTPQAAGGIISMEAPIHLSNVMPIDPTTGKPTRVKHKVVDGKKVRVGKSGAVIGAAS